MSKEKVSFFKTEVKYVVYRMYIFIFVLGICSTLIFMIVGLALAKSDPEKLKAYISLMMLLATLVFLPFYPGPRFYKRIEKLFVEENELELVRIARRIGNRGSVALCALYDLSSEKVKPILDEYHVKGLNSRTDLGLIKRLTKRMLEEEAIEKSIPKKVPETQAIVPITKAYFIKNRSELMKGMISKTQLTLDYEVVICPYCSNMAKKELLTVWLKEKKNCPVCFTQMTIDDCPIVYIKD